jgi:organic radical activating enzyme
MSKNSTLNKGTFRDVNGSVMHVNTNSIGEIQNADELKSIRLEMLSGIRPQECEYCWTMEDAGTSSRRKTANNQFKNAFTQDDAIKITNSDGSIDIMPMYYDLRFGNLCNIKCVMCYPSSSSQWYEDHYLITGKPSFDDNGKIIELKRNAVGRLVDEGEFQWAEDPRFWDRMNTDAIKSAIKQIYMVGGEPMLIERHLIFLKQLVEEGYSKNITLEYDTNLTVIKNEYIEIWSHFKHVMLRCSIEDIEDQNDLIRFPSNWEIIKKNFNKLKDRNLPNVNIKISCVWQALNSFTFARLYSEFPNTNILLRILTGPGQLDVKILPKRCKIDLLNLYKSYDPSITSKISHLIEYIEQNINYPDSSEELVTYLDKLDSIRHTNWRAVFPKLASYI